MYIICIQNKKKISYKVIFAKEEICHNFMSERFKEKAYSFISFIMKSRLSNVKYLIFFMKNIDCTKFIKINKKI